MESIFAKRILYRRYNVENDNVTGDLARGSYIDIPIFAEVQIQGENDNLVKFGHLKIGDAEGFFKGIYEKDANGNRLTQPLEAKVRDEVLFNNKWYRIKSLIPEYFTEGNVIFYDCMMVMIEDEVENRPLDKQPVAQMIVLSTDDDRILTDGSSRWLEAEM